MNAARKFVRSVFRRARLVNHGEYFTVNDGDEWLSVGDSRSEAWQNAAGYVEVWGRS